jgi:hypothetical protein
MGKFKSKQASSKTQKLLTEQQSGQTFLDYLLDYLLDYRDDLTYFSRDG